MVEDVQQNFFNHSLGWLKACGCYLKTARISRRTKLLQNINAFFWITITYLLFCPAELVAMIMNANDMARCISIFRDFANHIGCIYKTIVWYTKQNKIAFAVREMTSKKFTYEDHGDFQPERIFLKHKLQVEKRSKIFMNMLHMLMLCITLAGLYSVFIEEGGNGDIQRFPVIGDTKMKHFGFLLVQIIPLWLFGHLIISKCGTLNCKICVCYRLFTLSSKNM